MRRPRRGGVAALAVIPLSLMALFAYFIATYEGPLLPSEIGREVGDGPAGDAGAPAPNQTGPASNPGEAAKARCSQPSSSASRIRE